MDCGKLFAKIDELKDEYVTFLADICSIESPTNYKEGVDRVCEFITDRAKKFGWEVEIQHQEVSGNAACITMNPSADKKSVCFSAHMDTVHPVGLFGTPAVKIKDGKLYGPGATDCKGGIASSFLAMHALAECGFTDRPVKLILQSDEETSSKGSKKATVDFMAEKAKDCVAFLNCEGFHEGEAILQRKGISRYLLEIEGKAAHSARCYQGISAIREAAHKIIELEKYKEPDGITINCGTINGGTAVNTVPENCSIVVDIRFANTEEMEKSDNFVKEIAQKAFVEGTTSEISLVSRRVAMEKNERNLSLLDKMNDIYAKTGLPVLKAGKLNGGSDAADLTARGIPSIDSMGVLGDFIHNKGEFAYIDSLTESAKRLATVAMFIE